MNTYIKFVKHQTHITYTYNEFTFFERISNFAPKEISESGNILYVRL